MISPKIDQVGLPIYNSSHLIEMLYQGHTDAIFSALCDPDDHIRKFNAESSSRREPQVNEYTSLDITREEFDTLCQSEWLMPAFYKNLDILEYLKENLENFDDLDHHTAWPLIEEEVAEFKKRNLENLLRYMIYLVTTMRENNIVWGVGRGSSVSSVVLYVIGIHRINPIKYGLHWKDFLK